MYVNRPVAIVGTSTPPKVWEGKLSLTKHIQPVKGGGMQKVLFRDEEATCPLP